MKTEQIQSKIFIGFFLTPDLRSKILSNQQWKIDSLLTSQNSKLLREIRYHDKHYIGLYLDKALSVAEVKKIENFIKQQLLLYLDLQNIRQTKLVLFPQLFIN